MSSRVRARTQGCALFALYALTAGRSVGWGDSAFFQLCHAVLGVPHGPGFPLYVLVGRVWSLPFGHAVAWAGNLLSAGAMAASGALLVEIMLLFSSRLHRDGNLESEDSWGVASAVGVVMGG